MLLNTCKHHHIETIFIFKLLDLSSPWPYCTAADPQLIEQLERFFFEKHYIIIWIKVPSKHFLFSKTSSGKHFLSSKTSWRCLQDVVAIRLPKTSSRRLQHIFKTSSKRLPRRLQDVFVRRLAIMSSRRLQGVLEDKTNVCWVYTAVCSAIVVCTIFTQYSSSERLLIPCAIAFYDAFNYFIGRYSKTRTQIWGMRLKKEWNELVFRIQSNMYEGAFLRK